MSFPIKADIYIYIMNRNFNSGHLFINPPGKRSVDSQPVKMKPKTRAMQCCKGFEADSGIEPALKANCA